MVPIAVLNAFNLDASCTVTEVQSGIIHRTFRVACERGTFVLQRVHDVISDAAIEDMARVTAHVVAHGILAPALVRTTEGSYITVHDGARWRAYPWIAGEVYQAVTGVAMAREAGRIVGALHRALATLPYSPAGSIPHFHDTEFILSELESVRSALPTELQVVAGGILTRLPRLIIRDEAGPKQPIHGDLKISNILFSKDGVAVGVIDFDTVLVHYRTIDIGDALRSWCNKANEEDSRATFDQDLFEAAVTGYEGVAPSVHTLALYARAAKHIALELSARFMIDAVRDNYFSWDQSRYSTRKAHNIARALGQYYLAEDIPL
jgi:Ser/Thr protein kinase RdoA (MazF antagonist)